jgi:DNA uptake protein ComE-like DNA-binding protein
MKRKFGMTKVLLAGLALVFLVSGCSAGAPQPSAEASQATVSATTVAPEISTEPAAAPAAEQATEQPTLQAAAQTGMPTPAGAAEPQATAFTKINLNTATDADFASIPGVAGRMVREFLEYRPYVSIEQFRREIGKYVSAEQVAEYEKFVYVPVAVNDADAATLMQIPGLDESEAQALMAARPFASNEAFLTALAAYLSPDELALAANYLNIP